MRPLPPIAAAEPVAITIATRDRPAYLAALVASLLNQTYPHWMLVLNDQSTVPVTEDEAIVDLLRLARTQGHSVSHLRTSDGAAKFQAALEAVPAGIDVVLKIDDDLVARPDFLANLLAPFRWFPKDGLAAVGGCYPEPHMQPLDLDVRLADPAWVPRLATPTWRLQGHAYTGREVVDVESLFGPAICFRRTAVLEVGGWVDGGAACYRFYRDDSDLSARLVAAGYRLMVSTAALAWHLYAPSGPARRVLKSPAGNIVVKDPEPAAHDETLFRARIVAIDQTRVSPPRPLTRYAIAELEQGERRPRPLLTWRGRVLAWGARQARQVRQQWTGRPTPR